MFRSQRTLEVYLSKLKNFTYPSVELEQYATPAHIAAEWVWSMALRGEVAGKIVLDAACGPGILGIGLLLLGAKKVFFVDKDPEALRICQENFQNVEQEYEIGPAVFVASDISLFEERVDIVVQNPPFGTKTEHLDKHFLEKAFVVANLIYSMHKYTTARFVEAISRDHGFRITNVYHYDFPIKAAFPFHEKPVVNVEVGLWRMERRSVV